MLTYEWYFQSVNITRRPIQVTNIITWLWYTISTHLNIQTTCESEAFSGDINNNSDFRNTDVVICETTSDSITSLRPLAGIWDCGWVKRFTTGNNNTKLWWCRWCPNSVNASGDFSICNATKPLYHVFKISGYGVFPCAGQIITEYLRI